MKLIAMKKDSFEEDKLGDDKVNAFNNYSHNFEKRRIEKREKIVLI